MPAGGPVISWPREMQGFLDAAQEREVCVFQDLVDRHFCDFAGSRDLSHRTILLVSLVKRESLMVGQRLHALVQCLASGILLFGVRQRLFGEGFEGFLIKRQRFALLRTPPFEGHQSRKPQTPRHKRPAVVIGAELLPQAAGQVLKQVVRGMQVMRDRNKVTLKRSLVCDKQASECELGFSGKFGHGLHRVLSPGMGN